MSSFLVHCLDPSRSLSDIDTLFVNPLATLDTLLPLQDGTLDPFLLVTRELTFLNVELCYSIINPSIFPHPSTEDHNGLNAGVFLLKVDLRSLKFVMDVLSFDRSDRRLGFYEQTAMQITIKEQNLVEHGQAVFMPSEFFNSYLGSEIGEKAFEQVLPTVLLHYPSREAKRDTLIPHLHRVIHGRGPIITDMLLSEGQKAFEISVEKFWKSYTVPQ